MPLLHWKSLPSPRLKKLKYPDQNLRLWWLFFDIRGILYINWVRVKNYYLQVLATFRERVRRKQPELWKNKIKVIRTMPQPTMHWLLRHFWISMGSLCWNIHLIHQIQLCDCCMFLKVKETLKGTRFTRMEAVKEVTETINMLLENDLKHCWKKIKSYTKNTVFF